MAQFYLRREYRKGDLRVQTGFRGGDLQARILLPDGATFRLSMLDLYDLADLAAEACDQQDDDPLL